MKIGHQEGRMRFLSSPLLAVEADWREAAQRLSPLGTAPPGFLDEKGWLGGLAPGQSIVALNPQAHGSDVVQENRVSPRCPLELWEDRAVASQFIWTA